jgi:hypothetical protein
MKNLMMKTLMMLMMTMDMRMGTTMIITTIEKVVLVALWLVATMMLPPLVMGMAGLIMLP